MFFVGHVSPAPLPDIIVGTDVVDLFLVQVVHGLEVVNQGIFRVALTQLGDDLRWGWFIMSPPPQAEAIQAMMEVPGALEALFKDGFSAAQVARREANSDFQLQVVLVAAIGYGLAIEFDGALAQLASRGVLTIALRPVRDFGER